MFPAGLKFQYFQDRTSPLQLYAKRDKDLIPGNDRAPFAIRVFANAGRDHMKRYGTTMVHLEKIAEKNRKHGSLNPKAQF